MPSCFSSIHSFRDGGLFLCPTAEQGPRVLHTLVVNSHNNPPQGDFTIPILQINKQELNPCPNQLGHQDQDPSSIQLPSPCSIRSYYLGNITEALLKHFKAKGIETSGFQFPAGIYNLRQLKLPEPLFLHM